jgi:uncharacterized protein
MNPFEVLQRHYEPNSDAFSILVVHSVLVARKARDIALAYLERHPEASVDLELLAEASLLHDIGIKHCDAPEIGCRGTESYVRHGILGKAMLDAEGLPRHALVCARHTGAGMTREEVLIRRLPLPLDEYLPVSLEEKIICVADKFYSKQPDRLWKEKRLEAIAKGLAKHGPASLARWEALRREFLSE